MRIGWVWVAVGMTVAANAQAREKGCTVEGKPVEPFIVDVTPKGPSALTLHIRVGDTPVSVRPELTDQPAHVEVQGALAFEGSAARVPYRIRRNLDVNGILDLPVGTGGLSIHRFLRGKLVDAQLTIGDVEIRGLVLPCDALGIVGPPAPEPPASEEELGERVTPAERILHVQQRPGSGAKAVLELKGAPGELELRIIESEGRFHRVSTHWLDGTVLTGWVAKEELRPAGPARAELELPPPAPPACTPVTTPKSQARSRIVVATIAPGTQVFSSRYVGPWAKVRLGEGITIRYRQKDDWVELVRVPGIATESECPGDTLLDDAWVPRAAVKLPASEDAAVWPEREPD